MGGGGSDVPSRLRAPVLGGDVPGPPGTARPPRRRRVLITLVVVLLAFSGATARLFVWPDQGMPARVDAIVMLNGDYDPLGVALRLARERRAKYLVVSQGTRASHFGCPRPVPRVRIICFYPSPATTQGETEFAARLAARYGWHSLTLVTMLPQASRARLRMERCFAGHIYVVTSPIPRHAWPYQIAYEWAATVKALVLQRGC